MRILRVIASMNPVSGGPCEGIRNSIPAMERQGIVTEVACLNDPDALYVRHAPFRIYAFGPAKGPYAYCSKFAGWLDSNIMNYDAIIVHGLWLYNSYGTFRIWKSRKLKDQFVPRLFVMPHGMLDPYFQKSKKRRFKALRNWLFWNLIERKVLNGADGVLFTCQQELLLARETFSSYFPKAEFNVGYGIMMPPAVTNSFREEFLKVCPQVKGQSYWLYLSRIHPKKGLENLIEAYVKLKGENKNIPHLVIAGPGLESSFGKKIVQMAMGYPIHFPGMLTGPAKWGAFYCCDAFMLPSHQENFGIAVVEALACGKPVLISNKVNICKEVENGKAGMIANDSFAETFSLLKKYYQLQPEEQLSLGKNARSLFLKKYQIDRAANEMLQVLQQDQRIKKVSALSLS